MWSLLRRAVLLPIYVLLLVFVMVMDKCLSICRCLRDHGLKKQNKGSDVEAASGSKDDANTSVDSQIADTTAETLTGTFLLVNGCSFSCLCS